MKKTYILDTSVYLTNSNSIYSYGNNDIIVPLKVLEELDKHKTRADLVGQNARHTIKIFDELRSKNSLSSGVRLRKGSGTVISKSLENSKILTDLNLDPKVPDNQIIGVALQEKLNSNRKVIVVSRDIHMRVMCDAIGLQCETYDAHQVVESREELYTGIKEILVDQEFIDQFYAGKEMFLSSSDAQGLFPNQFLVLVSNSSQNSTALARWTNQNKPLRHVLKTDSKRDSIFGMRSKNKEQTFALDLLMDIKVPIVSLVGLAGSGKTILSTCAGLSQVIESEKYNKLIVARPIQPMGKDIGFLPGSVTEKLLPWLAPIQDNLESLMGDKATLQEYMDRGIIELEALTYIRGRSIANAFIIIDECFPGDTRIGTEAGKVKLGKLCKDFNNNIELPKVLSFDEAQGIFAYKKIKRVWSNGERELCTVVCGNRKVKCTPNHKFLTTDGYKPAAELEPGTILVGTKHKQRKHFIVDKVIKNTGVEEVFDMEVEDLHNFVVCSTNQTAKARNEISGVVVHNCQNLSQHEIKTIITRVGENTKIVLTGDVEQIDNSYLNDTSNGLAYAVEKFKSSELAGHVTLRKGERSPVAALAAEVL